MGNGKIFSACGLIGNTWELIQNLTNINVMQLHFLCQPRNLDLELALFREIEKLKEELRVRRESEDQMKQVFQNTRNVDFNHNSLFTRF